MRHTMVKGQAVSTAWMCMLRLALQVGPLHDRVILPLRDRIEVSADTPFPSSGRTLHKRGFFVFAGCPVSRGIASHRPFVSVFAYAQCQLSRFLRSLEREAILNLTAS